MRAAAAANHAGHLHQDLHRGQEAAEADRAQVRGQRGQPTPRAAAEGDPRRQVPLHHRGAVRRLLVARPHPQLPHAVLRPDTARPRHVRGHHSVPRQLRRQPHHLRLPHPGLQEHLPENPGPTLPVPQGGAVPQLQRQQAQQRPDPHDHRPSAIERLTLTEVFNVYRTRG